MIRMQFSCGEQILILVSFAALQPPEPLSMVDESLSQRVHLRGLSCLRSIHCRSDWHGWVQGCGVSWYAQISSGYLFVYKVAEEGGMYRELVLYTGRKLSEDGLLYIDSNFYIWPWVTIKKCRLSHSMSLMGPNTEFISVLQSHSPLSPNSGTQRVNKRPGR